MFKHQKLGFRIIFPVAFTVIVFSLVLYFLGTGAAGRLIDANLDDLLSAKVVDIHTSIERVSGKMLGQAALFSRADAVQDAYEIAYTGDITREEDPRMDAARGALRQYFASLEQGYKSALGGKAFRIHFHLPPARSLLRLWKTGQNRSDDLTAFRNTILTIGKGRHEPVKGIEIGRGGFAIRGLAPVFSDDQRYLGSVEVLSSFDPVVKYSISSEKEFIAVYMNREFLSIATRLQNPDRNPLVGDRFVFVSSTDKARTDHAVTPELLKMGMTGKVEKRVDNDMVCLFPVNNFNGEQIGVIAFVYDAKSLFSRLNTMRWGVAVLCLALFLGVGIPLVFAVRGVSVPLDRLIRSLDASSSQVAEASSQVSEASQSLAEGASGQAASIEQTSASLEQIFAKAKQNAQGAREADSLMSHTREVVEEADRAMTDLTESMAQINTAGQKISKIIKTIDEIAFQTNLLALNAAVEAARAGEAGAGFAVVADEVRSLAIRAAEAAQNTTGMIQLTIDRVRNGTEIVSRTNETFSDVRTSSRKVGELIQDIAQASEQQSSGVEQVNSAVSHMDRVVQQNAANAEESAASARELSGHAGNMKDVVLELTRIAGGRAVLQGAAGPQTESGPAGRPGQSFPAPQDREIRPGRQLAPPRDGDDGF